MTSLCNFQKSYNVNSDDNVTNIFLVVWVVLYTVLRNLSSDITQYNAFPPENNIYNMTTQRK